MGVVGGIDHGETARAIMKRLLTNAVAQHMNWAGKGGKMAFSRMSLFTVVCGKCTFSTVY